MTIKLQCVELANEGLPGIDVIIADTVFYALKSAVRRFNNSQDIGAAPMKIEDNVFIGTGFFVLKGVCVGTNSVNGAMSVVCKNVLANLIAGGWPARILRSLDEI